MIPKLPYIAIDITPAGNVLQQIVEGQRSMFQQLFANWQAFREAEAEARADMLRRLPQNLSA